MSYNRYFLLVATLSDIKCITPVTQRVLHQLPSARYTSFPEFVTPVNVNEVRHLHWTRYNSYP